MAAVCHGGAAGETRRRPGGEWGGKVPPGRRAGGTPQRGGGWEWYTKEKNTVVVKRIGKSLWTVEIGQGRKDSRRDFHKKGKAVAFYS